MPQRGYVFRFTSRNLRNRQFFAGKSYRNKIAGRQWIVGANSLRGSEIGRDVLGVSEMGGRRIESIQTGDTLSSL